jgi:hypothetical protein
LGEKLEHILTAVFSKRSIKGGPLWNRFKALKKLRDRLVHLKHFDSRARSYAEDDWVWADLYLSRDTDFSKQAHEIVIYFNRAARTWARKLPLRGARTQERGSRRDDGS